MRNLKMALALIVMAALFAACDDGTQKFDENVTVNPTDPMGSIGGVILDANTDEPLEAVSVSAVVGDYFMTTTTDASGVYSFSQVPASGSALLLISADGYLNARETVVFSEAEGNTPYLNPTATARPIWLVRTGHTLQVRVIDAKGRPVSGLPLTLFMDPSWFVLDDTDLKGSGEFSSTAATDSLGLATFSGLPYPGQLGASNFASAQVYIPEVDVDGDGYAEYNSQVRYIDVRYNEGTIETVNLSNKNPTNLTVTSSNNPYFLSSTTFPGAFAPGDSIYVSFNQPVSDEDLTVTLYEATDSGLVGSAILHTLNGNMLVFDLPDTVTPGEKYYVHVYAHTVDNGSIYQKSVPVFIYSDAAPSIVNIAKVNPLNATSPIEVTFDQYIGTGSSAYTNLVNSNGVVFLNFDYDTSNVVGDGPGENGYYTTQITFYSDEQSDNPAYSSGTLGFSKVWIFDGYAAAVGPDVNTGVFFNFDNPVSSGYRMRTPDGEPVPNLNSALP